MPEQIQQILDSLPTTAMEAAPRVLIGELLAALFLLVLASVIERVLRAILTSIRFDSLLAQAGPDRILQKLGIRPSLNAVLPRLAQFLGRRETIGGYSGRSPPRRRSWSRTGWWWCSPTASFWTRW